MGAQKQVVHFQAKKGFSKAQSNEQQRKWTEKAWKKANENGRIDRTRTRLNFEVVRGGKVQAVDQSKSIPELFLENIRARGIKDPNEKCPHDPKYRTVADFIISGSHDTLCRMAFGSQGIDYGKDADNGGVERHPEIEQWAKDMYDVLAERFGEENILSFIVHLDERSPHIHADLIPIKDGRISFKEVFCGSDKYEYAERTRALHDAFAEVNRKWGLERGDSVNETHRKHQSTEDYRRELSNECSTLERELESKAARLSNLKSQIHIAEIRKKSLTTMVSNLEAARERIEDEINGIRTSLTDDGMATVQRRALMKKEVSLQKKLEEILWKLADKRGKLVAAEKKHPMKHLAVRWLGHAGRKQLRPWYFLFLAFLMWAPLNGVGIPLDNYVLGLRMDHLLHASVFIPCTLFLYDLYRQGCKWAEWATAVAVGVFTEMVQWLLPYRGFDINDMIANFLGVSLGWLAILFVKHKTIKKKKICTQ